MTRINTSTGGAISVIPTDNNEEISIHFPGSSPVAGAHLTQAQADQFLDAILDAMSEARRLTALPKVAVGDLVRISPHPSLDYNGHVGKVTSVEGQSIGLELVTGRHRGTGAVVRSNQLEVIGAVKTQEVAA